VLIYWRLPFNDYFDTLWRYCLHAKAALEGVSAKKSSRLVVFSCASVDGGEAQIFAAMA
jgi:hypothetical protein